MSSEEDRLKFAGQFMSILALARQTQSKNMADIEDQYVVAIMNNNVIVPRELSQTFLIARDSEITGYWQKTEVCIILQGGMEIS